MTFWAGFATGIVVTMAILIYQAQQEAQRRRCKACHRWSPEPLRPTGICRDCAAQFEALAQQLDQADPTKELPRRTYRH